MDLGNGVSSPGRDKQEKGLGANSDSPSSMQKPHGASHAGVCEIHCIQRILSFL